MSVALSIERNNRRIVQKLDRVAPDVVEPCAAYNTGIVLDSTGKCGAMTHEISPLASSTAMCGPAVTSFGPDLTVGQMAIDLAQPSDVLELAASDFLDAIEQDRDPWCSARDGGAAIEIIHAAYAAQLSNTTVPLPLATWGHPLRALTPSGSSA